MPLIRGHHAFDDHFTQIPNNWVRDSNLSLKAIGLLTQLMSHRPGWNMSISSLARFNKTGVRTIKSAVQELELFGYLVRSEKQEHNADGTFADYVWTTADPLQNGVTAKSVDAKVHTKNTITKEQQSIKNKQENISFDSFDEFWNHYPKKLSKAQALKAWKSAIKRKPDTEIIEAVKAYSLGKLPDVQFIPLASTWLNNDRWDDVDLTKSKPSEFKTGVFYN
jgi:hypothetical protein